MKFPYIPIQPLIDEALEDVKKIAKTVNYNDGDCYVWAIDTAREIGGYAYEESTTEIEVKKHIGFVPKNFYLVSEIWKCRANPIVASEPVRPSNSRPDVWIRTELLRPADAETRRKCHNCTTSTMNIREQGNTFKLKIPPGTLRFSFMDGVVSMDYYHLPMQDGEVMVQDEVNGTKCIKAYITMMLVREDWISGKMRGDVWADLKGDYDTYLRLAQQMQKAPDPSHTDYLAAKQDQRYRNMRYIYQ